MIDIIKDLMKTMKDVIIKVMWTRKNVITNSRRMIEVNSANLAISPVELAQMIVGSVFMSAVQKATTEVKTGIVILTVKSSFNLITESREIYQIMSVVFIRVETQEKPLIEIKPAIITIRTKVYLETKPKVF